MALLLAVYLQTAGDVVPAVWTLLSGVPTALAALSLGWVADRWARARGYVAVMWAAISLVVVGLVGSVFVTGGLPFFTIGVALAFTTLLLPLSRRVLLLLGCGVLIVWALTALGDASVMSNVANLFQLDTSAQNYGHTTWLALMPAGVVLSRGLLPGVGAGRDAGDADEAEHSASSATGTSVEDPAAWSRFARWAVPLGVVAVAAKAGLLLTSAGASVAASTGFQRLAEAFHSTPYGYARGFVAYLPGSGGVPDLVLEGAIALGVLGVAAALLARTPRRTAPSADAADGENPPTRPLLVQVGAMAASLFVLHTIIVQAVIALTPNDLVLNSEGVVVANSEDVSVQEPIDPVWYYTDDEDAALENSQYEQFLGLLRQRLDAIPAHDMTPKEMAVVLSLGQRTVATANTWMDTIETPVPNDLTAVDGLPTLAEQTREELLAAKDLREVLAIGERAERSTYDLVGAYWRAHGRPDLADVYTSSGDPAADYEATAYPAAAAAGPGVAWWRFFVDAALLLVVAWVARARALRGPLEALCARITPRSSTPGADAEI
ncbi:hypothetical protein C1Y63_05450 [Corynebacterium sp. 13CS0277]|uniref:hypothetical protein n=1 Tax=Corynebacterium sp. 13CS0277 TaxID=2071994 RepID=UPI000D02FBA1|nr:hypothetical protein [Corynebacterium sp. 13CS0277]PRQ11624.1 hypothetical protein C1Y63_05450 [Corynebacterium sp. 13CS0277]